MSTDAYIITSGTGIHREQRRYALASVEAFFSKDKYVMARLTDGKEIFPAVLQAPQETFQRKDHGVVTLRDIEGWLARIGNRGFVRPHRGWLANMQHVRAYRAHRTNRIQGGELITTGDRKIPASRRASPATKRAFQSGAFA